MTIKMTVADAVAKVLLNNDIDRIFFLTGGDQPLWLALKAHGVEMILAHSENSAAYMADGYVRASGKVTCAYGQAGPGAANLAAGLADPFWGKTPLLALTSNVAEGACFKYEYQELNQMPMFDPVTGWNKPVVRPDRTPDLLTTAIAATMKGAGTPAHISIPKDYFSKEIEVEERFLKKQQLIKQSFYPDFQQIEECLKMLNEAKRPVILAGSGTVLSGAGSVLVELVENLQIPVVTSIGGKGIIPEYHSLAVGVVGRYSRKVANDILSEADCVLVVGSGLGGLVTRGYAIPKHDAKLIRMDISSESFRTTYLEDLSIICDAKAGLSILKDAAAESKEKVVHNEWAEKTKKRVEEWVSMADEASVTPVGATMRPQTIIKVLNETQGDISVVADTGFAAAWTGAFYNARGPKTYFRAVGSLGWSFPASLGVQMGQPQRKVVCVTGDGGFGYHVGDIETAVRYNIPVTVVVLNNSSLGFEHHDQKIRFNGRTVPEINDFVDVNYAAVAEGFGAEGIEARTEEDFRIALTKGLQSNRPTIINVIVDKDQIPPVTNFERFFDRKI